MHLLGNPLDFLIAFFGGVLISFTPCVYPLIPISVGYIIGNAQNSRREGFLLSLSYVSGIAVTYSCLGILAAISGSIFGRISSNPAVNLVSGIIIFVLGIFMLDVFKFNLGISFKIPRPKNDNFISAFLVGLISGLMISPCLTPILASILAYISTTKNVFYGGFLLFCFSYGMGLIFILLGTFGSALWMLPKPGKWMLVIKKASAVLILIWGLYFIISAIRRF